MGHGLFFAGEDSHAEGGDSHEGRGRGDHIIGAGGGVLLILGGLGGLLGGGDDDGDGAGFIYHILKACTVFGFFPTNIAPGIPGHSYLDTFGATGCFYNLATGISAVGGGIIADGDGGTLTNIIKADDAVADVLEGIAGDDNIAVVASTFEILNGNGIVAGCIKSTALYRDIFDMACINALMAIRKGAVFNGKITDLTIVILIVVAQRLSITACRSIGGKGAAIKGEAANDSAIQGRSNIHIAREIQPYKLDGHPL